ncbi:15174_t:CDS:2, partial [Cetraspora pellucida]
MTLCCDRDGVYSSSGIHQRQTSTWLIDCPFELYAARHNNLWHIKVCDSSYNHDLSEDLSDHPMPCRTPVEALIDELREDDYIYKYKCDDISYITHLFFTYNELVMLTRQYSTTEEEFNMKWKDFLNTYINKLCIISYLEEIWMPWKKKFIKAWTNKFLHLETTVTSRVKDAHATLKTYLHTSAGDLHIIHEQYRRLKCVTIEDPLLPCTKSFSSTMGLPCAHKIQLLENNQGLILLDFHEHWWIQ